MQQTTQMPPSVMAEPLTAEAFAAYGQVLERPAVTADIEKGWLGYWHALADVGFQTHPVWGWLEVRHRAMILNELERHCAAHEVFIAMQGASLMAFATGGSHDDRHSVPDPATLRVFRIEPGQAVVVGRGVWHTPSWPLGETAGFLLALEHATPADDLDFRAIGPFVISG